MNHRLGSKNRDFLYKAEPHSMVLIIGFSIILVLVLSVSVIAQHYTTLQAQSEATQKRVLQAGINSAGYACENITAILFMGSDQNDSGYWTVACSDGGNWMVQVKDDAAGTMTVTPCAIMEQAGVKCWQKF